MNVTVTLPLRTVSEANVRCAWSVRSKRTAKLRYDTCIALRPRLTWTGDLLEVSLTRWSPRTLDDDNLRPALKAIRDGVADALGIKDDSDPRVRWTYHQLRGTPGVTIQVRSRIPSLLVVRGVAEEDIRAGAIVTFNPANGHVRVYRPEESSCPSSPLSNATGAARRSASPAASTSLATGIRTRPKARSARRASTRGKAR